MDEKCDSDTNETVSSEWVDLIGSEGLKKKIIKEGYLESRPQKGDCVRISAIGQLENGEAVHNLDDITFTVGDGEVIAGLDLAVETMNKDEECDVFMESRFAYGSLGLLPNIPAHSNVIYTIKLYDYKCEDEPSSLSVQERLDIGIRKRERGNWWYKRDQFTPAIRCYKAALDFLDDTSDTYGEFLENDVRELLDERIKTLNNMAAAQMKIDAFDVALVSIEGVLKCQPKNLKALFRKAKILESKGEYSKALEVVNTAITLDPESKFLENEFAKLKLKAREEKDKEKSLYRKMFGFKNSPVDKNSQIKKYSILRGVMLKYWFFLFFFLLMILFTFEHYTGYFSSMRNRANVFNTSTETRNNEL